LAEELNKKFTQETNQMKELIFKCLVLGKAKKLAADPTSVVEELRAMIDEMGNPTPKK
jgi:hypothetical protein